MYRDYPLPNHPQAAPAAEAAQCANEQGRFWEYHDAIFENQRQLSDDSYAKFAEDLGLDLDAFKTCFESGRFRESVRQDALEGQQAGVTGTPAFFINGVFLSGAQPFERFQAIIEDELRR